jgi:hypothetical protein
MFVIPSAFVVLLPISWVSAIGRRRMFYQPARLLHPPPHVLSALVVMAAGLCKMAILLEIFLQPPMLRKLPDQNVT